MKRRSLLSLTAGASLLAGGCAATKTPPATAATDAVQGTGDIGVVIERAAGALTLVNTSRREAIGRVQGLGDLSHASVVFSRDARYAFVFGRDGGLTRVDMLQQRITHRVMQAGNSIGGAISADGRLVVAQNYQPGGIKVFDAATLELLADVPASMPGGERSRVVGLADLPQHRFIYSLFDAEAICIADCSNPRQPRITTLQGIGRQPYDALLSPNGRHYIAGLFGEDGLAMVDLWEEQPRARRILGGYGRGEKPLPVYKMPHLRGWAMAGGRAFLPAIGRHEVLVVDTSTWAEVGRIPVAGQPVFVMARPDGRQVWVNFSVPDYNRVQVIDTVSQRVVQTIEPGKAVLHMEFTPRGESVWISCRDDNRVQVYDTHTRELQASLAVDAPSGIFFTARAQRMGF
ncbi:MAG: protein nirF [Alicycliphilus sp.]|jgi:protein NirF|uniref:Cytochrome D1 domain-containing protein n=1 Tax=Diaphorobacter limosus TaxID=3036128 RepID=A0ABZ0J8Y4_9BURK|nr:cytochrome D1 domain-containing protein [Diaphorobacter sp. Y-1]MBP7328285.1 protein nirF [Alicycliphilus sp.]MBP8779891.1 protein nirF [Alicycliphilus sp.]WOO33607.1 cytochrome D1 domain-containing protein [Diaphorobacter sp. Y-1]HRO53011.1 cytochrome D1 domain-containing protein [Alicycliphilus sp.]HRP21572.1 cytochrome D1 domain-containing protein [Alicycliphilus sp.]